MIIFPVDRQVVAMLRGIEHARFGVIAYMKKPIHINFTLKKKKDSFIKCLIIKECHI